MTYIEVSFIVAKGGKSLKSELNEEPSPVHYGCDWQSVVAVFYDFSKKFILRGL